MDEEQNLNHLVSQAVELLPQINSFIAREDQFRSKEFELTLSQLRFLRILLREGEATMGKLSEALRVAPPSATTTAERLVKQGLIVRKESAHDRRVVKIALSAKGKHLMERVTDSRRQRWREIMNKLSPDERENIISTLQRLLSLLAKAENSAESDKP